MLVMIYLSAALPLGCSSFPPMKESAPNAVTPEVETSPGSQDISARKPFREELAAPFEACWHVTLEVLKQFGYSIQEANQNDGWIRTFEKEFTGPTYPWRERYAIRITPVTDSHTLIKVQRLVKVYRPLFFVGPPMWMAKPSNGQRENMLIEKIAQRLDTAGAKQGEN